MQNGFGDRVLGVGIDRATFDALGIETVIATHREVVALGCRIASRFQLANTPPQNVSGVAILFVAGNFA